DKTLPTEFVITFEVNEKKYFYKISYNNKIILEESLFVYNSVKPSKIFERTGKEYSLSNEYESIRDLIERTHDNKLFLSVISQWVADKKEINDIYNFFKNDIIYFQNNYNSPSQNYRKKTTKLLTSDPNAGLFLKKIINYFNLEMNDIKADSFSIAFEKIPSDLRTFLESIQHLSKSKQTDDITAETIQSTYEINDKNYVLNFDEESNGTQKIYDLFSILYSGLNSKKIILLDEVEMGLHTLLAKQLIKLFQDLTINKFNSQLLFTTHDTNILDLEFLRRDQIWFARKKVQDNYATKLYSLATIPIRLSTNIVKNYIEGKYTVPLKFKW
ncbi:MAG: AAA family ATPase, partial [Cetobacterium sp.]